MADLESLFSTEKTESERELKFYIHVFRVFTTFILNTYRLFSLNFYLDKISLPYKKIKPRTNSKIIT